MNEPEATFMKNVRYVLILIASLINIGQSANGQGTIVFNNNTGLVQRWTSQVNLTPIPIPVGSDAFVQLVYAPIGTPSGPLGFHQSIESWVTDNQGWNLGSIAGFTNSEAGKFNGGIVTLTGIPAGENINYALFGWAGGQDLLFGGYVPDLFRGLSSTFTTSTGTSEPSAVPLADSFGGMVLVPYNLIPEPSTSSFLTLGIATILLLRRHRSRVGT
jgi:hypothetical protein